MSVKIAQLLHEVWMHKDRHQRLTADVQDMEKQIANLTRELADATRERDLLAYHVAPHTDEEFRSSHCAEQIIDAGLQARQDARDKALEEAAKVADDASKEWASDAEKWHKDGMLKTAASSLLQSGGADKVAAAIRALKDKP